MLYWLIPLGIGTVLLTIFLYLRGKGDRVKAVIFKGFVSLSFIITALVAWKCSSSPLNSLGIFVLLALSFGLLGDVFLDVKYIIVKYDLLFTILGFIVFLIGHVFYSIGLFVTFYDYSSNILYLIIPIIIALLLSIFTILMEKFTAIRYQKMKIIVFMYALALFFTTAIYFSTAIQRGWNVITLIIMAGGLISFAISDLILNNTYFAPGFDKPIFLITNHLFYYIGQFAIALSLFFLV